MEALKQQRQPLRLMLSLEMLGSHAGFPALGLERFYPNRGIPSG
ncbi:MAG: hypothetical protein Q6K55_00790 [Thermostichus sp. DG02_3_bins_51]